MKKASYIFEKMRIHLHSKDFLNNHKIGPKAFLRERLLTFPIIFLFIFNLLKKSIPKEQIDFCKNLEVESFSRSAVTKARAKLSPTAFVEMNRILLKEFYTDNSFKRFQGLITMAIDGSTLKLPINSPEILEKYGCATNQTKSEIPMARISTLYDVVNGITWDAIMAPYASNERDLAIEHINAISTLGIDYEKLLVIFDRGYPSLGLIVWLLEQGINFLMRTNNNFLKAVNDAVKEGKRDTIVKIPLKRATSAAKAEIKTLFPDMDFKRIISVRVVVVTLSTGEKEVLVTSLLDKEKYPYKIFRELYFKRWGTEENYKFVKVSQELENFSGKTCRAIEQDFHSTVLASNSRALLALEAMQEINCDKDTLKNPKPKKYVYEINKAVSMEALKHELIDALLDPNINMEQFGKKIKNEMKRNLIPKRPGRSFKRIRKHLHRKYHMNLR